MRVDEVEGTELMFLTTHPRAEVAVVAATGECDADGAERLEAALVDAAQNGARTVLAELRRLRFAEPSATAAVARAQRALEAAGCELVLVAPGGDVREELEAAGVVGVLDGEEETGESAADLVVALTQRLLRRTAGIFRLINERILEIASDWQDDEPVSFLCECPDPRCTRPVRLPRREFERICSLSGTRVLVHPAHGGAGWPVLEASDDYLVVGAGLTT